MEGLGGHHSLQNISVVAADASSASSSNRQRSSASALKGEIHTASSARFPYPKLTSTLLDKPVWSKCSRPKIHWQSQLQLDTPDQTMKKSDNTRSHSWWWDSHVCPKNSKWLQENLSEMDSKVSAMLKIIEADADSFAQRAEMFYKKRPELINLVEEFYRTYRALVERYTFLTREIRQNIAPALQGQFGVSSESAQNSPVDLHLKRGLDGPDIISPCSYTGASEFDFDSPVSDVSAKGHTDEEFSPSGYRINYERRAFGFKPRYSNVEESSHKVSESDCLHDTVDVGIGHLQKEIIRLQEENKALTTKSTEDVEKMKSVELELSSLQSKVRALEAEEKLTKKMLMAVQEKEQKLEAENLKLSHSLMSSKEEKTELLEQQNKLMEESKAACQKNQLLQDQMVAMKQNLVTAQSQLLEREEHLKSGEEAICTLQQALATLEEERLKDSFLMEIREQQCDDLLKRTSEFEEKNESLTKETLAQAAEIRNLHDQLTDMMDGSKVLEQCLVDSEHVKSATSLKVEELQNELVGAKRDKQDLSVQMLQQAGEVARLKEIICKLEEESTRAQKEKMEGVKHVLKLGTDIEEGQKAVETLRAICQQYKDRCMTLESDVVRSKDKLLSSSEEIVQYQNQLTALENMAASADLQNEELQKRVVNLEVEMASVMNELEKVLEQAKLAEGQCAEMHEVVQDKQKEIQRLKQELIDQVADTQKLKESYAHVSKEMSALVQKEVEILRAHQQLANEHTLLEQQLELNFTLSENLTNKISSLEIEKSDLVFESQQMHQKLLDLHTENTVLSSHCSNIKAGLQVAEAAATRAQEDLALSVSEVDKLQEENRAKAELMHKMMSNLESSETHLAKSREENRMLGEDMEMFTRKLADFEAQIKNIQSHLSESVTVNAALAEQLTEKGKRIEQLNHELSGAQEKIVETNEDLTSRTSHALNLQVEINILKEQVKFQQTELQKTSEAKQSLEALVEDLQQKDSEAKESNQSLLCEQHRLLTDVSVLQENNQDSELSISRLTGERAKLLEEVSTHSEQSSSMKQRIMSLESEHEALQIQIQSLQDQLVKVEEEKQSMEEENKSFSKKLFEAEGRVQDLQLKLSDLLCEETSLTEQLLERIDSIHNLEAALFDLQKDNATLSREMGLLQQQLSASRTREASLLAEMHDSSDLIQFLKVEMERLQQEVLKAEKMEKMFALEQKKNLDECLAMKQKIENLQKDLGLLGEGKTICSRDIATHAGQYNELDCEFKKLEVEKGTLQQELLMVQHMADQLHEDLKNLVEDRKQLIGILDYQKKEMEKQEKDLQSLQLEFCIAKEEQQNIMDKLDLLNEEKVAQLQELKESKQQAVSARDKFLKLETDFSQLQEMKGAAETELGNKIEEALRLQEDALILQTAKAELEQKLELRSRQFIAQAEEVRALQGMLAVAQLEKATLESQLVDAEKQIKEVSEECYKQKEGCNALTQELDAVFATKKKMEKELAEVEEEKTACTQKLEKMQQDLICLQKQMEQSALNLEAAILQGQNYEARLLNLQEQLDSAESSKLEMADKYSKMSLDWGAAERILLEEIANLKSASFQEREDLNLQCDRVIRLEDEIGNLQAESMTLQNDKALSLNQIVDLQQQKSGLKNELLQKQEEALNLSAQVDTLKKSLLSTEQEIADLRKLLQRDRENYGAAQKALMDELCLIQEEVRSKGERMIELQDTLFGLEKENDILLEGMSLKENILVELQKQVQLVREEKEETTQKLLHTDAQVVQLQANVKLLEAEVHALHEGIHKLQNEIKSANTFNQAQAQEHTLLKEQSKELTGASSNLQTENRMLKTKLADKSSALDTMIHELQVSKEGKEDAVKQAGLLEAQVISLQHALLQSEGECETCKRQADVDAEEVRVLKTEIQDLLANISDLQRQCQREHEKFEGSFTSLVLFQQDLAAARGENRKLNELVSDGARSAKNLQEQLSSLHESKQGLEVALNLLKGQLKDSQMMLDETERSQQAVLNELQVHSQRLFQMTSKIEDLDKMINSNATSRFTSIRHEGIMSQEDPTEHSKKQASDVEEPISSLNLAMQSHLSGTIHDKVTFSVGESFPSPQYPSEHNCSQAVSPLSKKSMNVRGANALGFETILFKQKTLFDAGVDAVDGLKEKILILLNEDNFSKSQSVARLGELSHCQQEIEHLTFELASYRKDISHLKEILEGNKLKEEGEVAHAEVRTLIHAWQESFVKFEETSRKLQDEVEMTGMEKRSLQLMLSDLQDKGLTFALLLKENLLLSGKGIKLLVGEWDKRMCSNGRHQFTECIGKLIKLEGSCTSSDLDWGKNMTQNEGEMLLPGVVKRSPPEILEPTVTNTLVLKELQKRAEEAILLRDAVEDMLMPTYGQDQGEKEIESEISSTTREKWLSMPMDKNQEQQQWSFSIEPNENASECDMEEADSMGDQTPDREDEVVGTGSLERAEEIDLIEGIARRLHINLGMRLHQALMDEKLENELQELKEERKQLEEGLQARMEQVQKMEAELEKLQVILKEGNEKCGMVDPRQPQQWLQRKKRAEKRARKLSKQLVLRRRQMGKMQDAVASWVEQQELATEILEEQVLFLVNKEISPTMEGWDTDQVNKLMEDMRSRKLLTRRHSLDLQSVERELKKVSSSIESTQSQLLSREDQEQLVQGGISNETTSINTPGITKKHLKLSRFGLTWLLLLLSTGRKGLMKRIRGSTPLTPEESAKQVTSSHTNSSTAMRTLVAQTRKMGSCACGLSANQHKSFNDK